MPPIEVAQARLDLDAAVAGLESRLDPHPVDRDRAHILELDGTPQAYGHLQLVLLGQARERGGRVRLEVAVVEQTHDVTLLVGLRLHG